MIFVLDTFLLVFDKERACIDLGLAQFKKSRSMTLGDYQSVQWCDGIAIRDCKD